VLKYVDQKGNADLTERRGKEAQVVVVVVVVFVGVATYLLFILAIRPHVYRPGH
jgi:hypothetical protein